MLLTPARVAAQLTADRVRAAARELAETDLASADLDAAYGADTRQHRPSGSAAAVQSVAQQHSPQQTSGTIAAMLLTGPLDRVGAHVDTPSVSQSVQSYVCRPGA